jgi:DNA-binding LytR/AlgR family response regulator
MKSSYFLFKNRDVLLRVSIANIVYFSASGNFTEIVTVNKLKRSVYLNLGQIEKLLKDGPGEEAKDFVRIGRTLIVNTRFVYMVDTLKREIILSDCITFTFKLSCSKESLKKVRELLSNMPENGIYKIETDDYSYAKPGISDNI